MKIWVDDIRPAPEGYIWCENVIETIFQIRVTEDIAKALENENVYLQDANIELLDLDHDAGDQALFGGDYIKILDWLEETGRRYPIRLHSANPVGVKNMRRIIERNGWEEIK